MTGVLTSTQIDNVLNSQVTGRLGCYHDGKVYVVPITYAYDGDYVYAHSREGMKIEMMRQNPNVCFETDIIENMGNWRSVILWGKFEEMKQLKDQVNAMKVLHERVAPLVTSQSAEPNHEMFPNEKQRRSIAFRIKVGEKSGRFEKRS